MKWYKLKNMVQVEKKEPEKRFPFEKPLSALFLMFCTKKVPEIQWEKENKEEKICANILYLNDSNIQ